MSSPMIIRMLGLELPGWAAAILGQVGKKNRKTRALAGKTRIIIACLRFVVVLVCPKGLILLHPAPILFIVAHSSLVLQSEFLFLTALGATYRLARLAIVFCSG